MDKSIATPRLDSVLAPDRNVLLLAAVDPTTTIYIPLVRSWHRRPTPASCQLLMGGWGPARLTRVSDNALVVDRLNPHWTAPDVYAAAFTRRTPRVGERFRSGELEAQVLKVVDGLPLRVRFEFQRSLNGPYSLIVQAERGLQPVELPALGQSIVLEPARLPMRIDENL